VGPSYSKMGPIRCIGDPQITFQVSNLAHIYILPTVNINFNLVKSIFTIKYLLHMYMFVFDSILLCGVL
jgi:hypothetical protein